MDISIKNSFRLPIKVAFAEQKVTLNIQEEITLKLPNSISRFDFFCLGVHFYSMKQRNTENIRIEVDKFKLSLNSLFGLLLFLAPILFFILKFSNLPFILQIIGICLSLLTIVYSFYFRPSVVLKETENNTLE